MSELDQELLTEFIQESRPLVDECIEALEDVEADAKKVMRLQDFSNRVDRIMGAAQSLAVMAKPGHPLHLIGDCASLCKTLGYQCLTSSPAPEALKITIAFLLDATDVIEELIESLEEGAVEVDSDVRRTLIERLKWVSGILSKVPASEKSPVMNNSDIDALIKKLGLG